MVDDFYLRMMLAIALSLGLSYILNRYMLKGMGGRVIYTLSPVVEECLKTIPAYILNVPLILAHFLFGAGEGVYDWRHSKTKYNGFAAILSLLSHTLFGVVSFYVLSWTASPIMAVVATSILHGLWNYFLIHPSLKQK